VALTPVMRVNAVMVVLNSPDSKCQSVIAATATNSSVGPPSCTVSSCSASSNTFFPYTETTACTSTSNPDTVANALSLAYSAVTVSPSSMKYVLISFLDAQCTSFTSVSVMLANTCFVSSGVSMEWVVVDTHSSSSANFIAPATYSQSSATPIPISDGVVIAQYTFGSDTTCSSVPGTRTSTSTFSPQNMTLYAYSAATEASISTAALAFQCRPGLPGSSDLGLIAFVNADTTPPNIAVGGGGGSGGGGGTSGGGKTGNVGFKLTDDHISAAACIVFTLSALFAQHWQ